MPRVVCKQCGANVSDEFSFCPFCKAPINGKPARPQIEAGKEVCPNCGAGTTDAQKFCANCGQALAISVEEVLNSTLRIIKTTPVIVLPTIIRVALSTILGIWISLPLLQGIGSISTPSVWLPILWNSLPRVGVGIVFGLIVSPIVTGMYPSMVQDMFNGKTLDITRAFRKAVKKYPSILASDILVGSLVLLASFLLLVPGLIVTVWYAYSAPAIVLEDLGALDGMSASKRFARNKKWATFVITLIPTGIGSLASFVRNGASFSSTSGLAWIIVTELVFGVIAGILSAVMLPYTYVSYALRKTTD
jgi:RNA polymerase subunit RPABC4/transcription elongation factor Spt4